MATKNAQEGFSINTSNVEPHDIIYEVDDMKLKENMRSCQHLLVDSEVESKIQNYQMRSRKSHWNNKERVIHRFFSTIKNV